MPDNLTKAQRRKAMQAVKSTNTSLEIKFGAALRCVGLRPKRNVTLLPGKPDFVFSKQRVIVFVDGDYWHGWRFSTWSHKLSPYWKAKIERNRRRDRRVHRRLRQLGWKVVRVWEHEIQKRLDDAVKKVQCLLN